MLLRTLFSRELFGLGLRDLRAHKLRSLLTALGVIFGVAAVICMLSIGEGASAEKLEQIRLLGSQNILLRSTEPPKSQTVGQAQEAIKKYGLTDEDVARIEALNHIKGVVKLRDVANTMVHGSRQTHGSVLGTTNNLFDVVNLRVARGRPLAPIDQLRHKKVCVIGAKIARELFPNDDPLGRLVTVQSPSSGSIPYVVVGILERVATAGNPSEGVAGRDINMDMYIPLRTAEMRYGEMKIERTGLSREITDVQFSDLYVSVTSEDAVLPVSEMVAQALDHVRDEPDYVMTVPLSLLLAAQREKHTRQIVLGSIAGISLLVGGIGIMNIMLASVTERTREIGIRRALGAKRHHITAQFLVQTLILSVLGGIIGIILGVGMAWLLTTLVQWQTIIPAWGVALSFFVSAAVGVVFGLYPARAAAQLDPIEALNSTARTA